MISCALTGAGEYLPVPTLLCVCARWELGKTLSQNAHCFSARPTLGFWTSCLSPVLLAHCLLLQSCLFVPGRLLFPTECFAFASTVSCSYSRGLI